VSQRPFKRNRKKYRVLQEKVSLTYKKYRVLQEGKKCLKESFNKNRKKYRVLQEISVSNIFKKQEKTGCFKTRKCRNHL
jgi:hypothetical protein